MAESASTDEVDREGEPCRSVGFSRGVSRGVLFVFASRRVGRPCRKLTVPSLTALQSFDGLDPSLLAAMLDSGEVDERLICRLWQSWPQDTRNTVVREVCSEIRELLVREIPDAPSLTEALVAALGLDEVKKLMNLLLQKAKLDTTSPLKNRVVAVTKTLVALRAAPKYGLPPHPLAFTLLTSLSSLSHLTTGQHWPSFLLPRLRLIRTPRSH